MPSHSQCHSAHTYWLDKFLLDPAQKFHFGRCSTEKAYRNYFFLQTLSEELGERRIIILIIGIFPIFTANFLLDPTLGQPA